VKITVERCDEFLVAVPQIFDGVKSVALWSTKKKKRTIKGYGSSATRFFVEGNGHSEIKSRLTGEHAVVGKETLKFGSIFGSLPDFPSLCP
jgi:hypothetical protein